MPVPIGIFREVQRPVFEQGVHHQIRTAQEKREGNLKALLNAGDTFTLSADSLVAGPNLLEFRQRRAGWVWGVTSLGVLTSPP